MRHYVFKTESDDEPVILSVKSNQIEEPEDVIDIIKIYTNPNPNPV